MAAGLRVGTCSWKYPSWRGLVYSGAEGIDYLSEYALRFDTVEVDQWFWATPERAEAARYAGLVPEDFRFTVKLPNALSLTHFYKKKGETELRPNPQFLSPVLYGEVLERLAPLAAKIGVVMLQFEYLNKQKMASQDLFLRALGAFADAVPRDIPCAIEPRNPQWVNERYFDFLRDKNLSHVFLHGYYMPPVEESWRAHRQNVRGMAVVRLHGPDREGMERRSGEVWDRILVPRDQELDRIVETIHDMRDHGLTVYLNVNNHFEGSAPLTIERLRQRGLWPIP